MPVDHFELFTELQQYVGWTKADADNVRGAADLLEPSFASLIDDFYEEIERHPAARAVITGGDAQVERLKGTLRQWLREMMRGDYDGDYVERRWRVGLKHVEIGLSQVYVDAALARLRHGLVDALRRGWQGSADDLWAVTCSLGKLCDLDLALIQSAYQQEHSAQLQRSERLATLGQLAGGVAHEMRNPLNVIRTSVYYLREAGAVTEQKQAEHLERIERQIELADNVITAMSRFTKMTPPEIAPMNVESCLREALLETAPPAGIEVVLAIPDDAPAVLADRDQIKIVFGNLIRNAREAMPDRGRLEVSLFVRTNQVSVHFCDTGPGIPPEQLAQVMEPLFTTKARGLGLGLAISRTILEENGGSIAVTSELGKGTTFEVTLPVARSRRMEAAADYK